ncbi:MAG: UbiX family flavin prenyltransferase [Planctomycetota bacterium]
MAKDNRIVVAVTGASGAAYARRLLQCLSRADVHTDLIISRHGRELLAEELGITNPTPGALVGSEAAASVTLHAHADVGAPPASGSFRTNGMVICPCSSNTLAEIAAGMGTNLIARAAAVHLKEARRLILLTRETPCSQIDLRNMLRISKAGGIICPASPGFYMRPKTIDDLVDFVVGRLCDLLGVEHTFDTRWDPHRPRRSDGA